MSAFAGYGGRVQIGGVVNLTCGRWQTTLKVDPLDVTNFESGGISNWIPGVTDIDASFEMFWDSTIDAMEANPPNLYPGEYINVKLYFDKGVATRRFSYTNFLVTDVSMEVDVRGVVKFNVVGKQSGTSFTTVIN